MVIGVGSNSYGHPTAEAITLYKKTDAAIHRTDLNGTVTVTVQPGTPSHKFCQSVMLLRSIEVSA